MIFYGLMLFAGRSGK